MSVEDKEKINGYEQGRCLERREMHSLYTIRRQKRILLPKLAADILCMKCKQLCTLVDVSEVLHLPFPNNPSLHNSLSLHLQMHSLQRQSRDCHAN